ncbi:MAG TPA: hypothetical protein VE153_30505, partial [Myxococcus sp.]|nr:hypothetical protein [Myxococcus sp.]
MKVSGPRIQIATEPKKESAPGTVQIDVRGRGRDGVSGKVSRSGDAHSDNLQTAYYKKPRDGFDAGSSGGGTRAGNLRIGESHADNLSRVPGGDSGQASTVQAGSIHTLLNRLFPSKPREGIQPHLPDAPRIGTMGTRNRFGDGHGDLVTLGEKPDFGTGINTGIVPPKPPNGNTGIVPPKPGTEFPVGGVYTGSVRDPNTGKKLPLLSKEALLDLKSPELTPKLVDRLAKATTLKKVDKLTRFLSGGVRDTVMRMAYASIR